MLRREREPEAAAPRLTPVADERADRVHRARVELGHAVQIEPRLEDAFLYVMNFTAPQKLGAVA